MALLQKILNSRCSSTKQLLKAGEQGWPNTVALGHRGREREDASGESRKLVRTPQDIINIICVTV